ncbi:hypothetical protein IEU95_07020 [Hoyosella rhizosphaerae]|uniref:Uncharacterized protein n=1 Tax=Hoyosella rhizosphaerae TaxID=1755582 RepID=A0A916U3E8_9ACTN|nr:hypothetical protein [Hoyosella rhizosphaerae]MBN4926573.1 hypothetical protein [Hoyosella rhizosphaerae]GGC58193.1 hypothetical protein GCM10011410_08350 [Hoyosella rhizosphaerae]
MTVGAVETGKDNVQELIVSAVNHVGQIAVIATGLLADVVRELGDFLTESLQHVQTLLESAVNHVGQIAVLITRAIAAIVYEIGAIVTDGFDMIDASKTAYQDRGSQRALAH